MVTKTAGIIPRFVVASVLGPMWLGRRAEWEELLMPPVLRQNFIRLKLRLF